MLQKYSLLLFIALAHGVVVGPAAAAESVYVDARAGVRLVVPFVPVRIKSAEQVTNLVLDHAEARLPDGAHFSSGLYAKEGLPYILIWTTPALTPLTTDLLSSLAHLSADEAKARLGLSDWRFDPHTLRGEGRLSTKDGLSARVLCAVANGATIFVGLYDKEAGASELFAQMAAGASLLPERRLDPARIPHESLVTRWVAALTASLVAGAGLYLALGRKRSL